MHRRGGGKEGRGEVSFDTYHLPFFFMGGALYVYAAIWIMSLSGKAKYLILLYLMYFKYAEAKLNLYLSV